MPITMNVDGSIMLPITSRIKIKRSYMKLQIFIIRPDVRVLFFLKSALVILHTF